MERVTVHNEENGFCVLRVKACGVKVFHLGNVGAHPGDRLGTRRPPATVRSWLAAGGEWIRTSGSARESSLAAPAVITLTRQLGVGSGQLPGRAWRRGTSPH
jgi:hypothetical protein